MVYGASFRTVTSRNKDISITKMLLVFAKLAICSDMNPRTGSLPALRIETIRL